MDKQKRVAAIHDISCFGKCSLTVALPILSAAGIEVSAIPTAVLSTHTGGLTGFTYRDLTEDILPIVRHWQSLNLSFDAIYTGYLGSFAQLHIVSELIDRLKGPDTLILVDPVMADNGSLYATFSEDFPPGMKELCAKADVLVPNITEAALLTGEAYCEGPHTTDYIRRLLHKLTILGPGQIVLTGVTFEDHKLGAACLNALDGAIDYIGAHRVDGLYHGTGDIFASALLAGLLNGCSLVKAAEIAVHFTVGSIERTKDAGTDPRFGVNFEAGLPMLARGLGLI